MDKANSYQSGEHFAPKPSVPPVPPETEKEKIISGVIEGLRDSPELLQALAGAIKTLKLHRRLD